MPVIDELPEPTLPSSTDCVAVEIGFAKSAETIDGTGIGVGLILIVLATILLKNRKQKANK